MSYTKESLEYTHPLYDELVSQWLFFYNSYRGGHAYKQNNYLTRYRYETGQDYERRKKQTPLDNHVKPIVELYASFLFNEEPTRLLGNLGNDPFVEAIMTDADRDGRSFNNFMREASVLSAVIGHCWVIVDKPNMEFETRQQELEADSRPYLSIINPINVVDWEYATLDNGSKELRHLKVRLAPNKYKCYYPDYTDTITIVERDNSQDEIYVETVENPFGKITAVCVYDKRDVYPGIGISAVSEVADFQRSIYDELSEIEQIIRLSSAPSLVLPGNRARAGAGAGSIIEIEDDLDPGLKPYLLQPNSASIDSIRDSIKDKVAAINKIANLGSIRADETVQLSGISRQIEFNMLNNALASKADQLELAEEQIWECIAMVMGYQNEDVTIKYPDSFHAQDTQNELLLIEKAVTLTNNQQILTVLEQKLAELFVDKEQLEEVLSNIGQNDMDQNMIQINNNETP